MIPALQSHYPEYLMEAAELAAFMMSACVFTVLLEHPGSWGRTCIRSGLARRGIVGIAMGLSAVALIYSSWGRRSGAHMNPAFTWAFLCLGKIAPWDAVFYILAQILGGVAGVAASSLLLGKALRHPSVQFAVTVPGRAGWKVAWIGELLISAGLMLVVLMISNQRELMHYTGVIAGILIALYITVEAPLSGMSMNPARTLGSAIAARLWKGWWIYWTAPVTGMLLASLLYSLLPGRSVHCAKLCHGEGPCIFRCDYAGPSITAHASPDTEPRVPARAARRGRRSVHRSRGDRAG